MISEMYVIRLWGSCCLAAMVTVYLRLLLMMTSMSLYGVPLSATGCVVWNVTLDLAFAELGNNVFSAA